MDEPWTLKEVAGAGGVPLVVAEGGKTDGPPILLLHGIGRSYVDFKRQFEGHLAKRYKLVAYDLRGHGNSGKPWQREAYHDPAAWADDMAAIMRATRIAKPVVVGWSYGGIVALDYIRVHGANDIAGMNFVGNAATLAHGKIVSSGLSPENLLALSVHRNIAGNRDIVERLVADDRGEEWRQEALRVGMMTPSYVRRAMMGRSFDYRDTLTTLKVPILLSFGELETGCDDALAPAARQVMPGAELSVYPSTGHSPFLEASERFDAELSSFVSRAQENQQLKADKI